MESFLAILSSGTFGNALLALIALIMLRGVVVSIKARKKEDSSEIEIEINSKK